MGPVREISLTTVDDQALDLIHASLQQAVDEVVATRDGRVWDVWSNARPFHVEVDPTALTIAISASCNQAEDHTMLERIANALLRQLGKYVEPCDE